MNNSTHKLSEDDLHAFVDGQLPPEQRRAIEDYLAQRPDEAQRMASYRGQKHQLRELLDPVLHEPPPRRLLRALRRREPWYRQRWVAGLALTLLGGSAGWGLHASLRPPPTAAPTAGGDFAQRAAVAHVVYSPELRRPVEVDAAHEEQLVNWLSKRMGAPMRPPHLQALGYQLEGGRLLPGGQGPVAQFMYRLAGSEGTAGRLTLYVSNEAAAKSAASATAPETGFRFTEKGALRVFYWVDGPFGYAISAQAERAELALVSAEVYRQLSAPRQ